MVTNTKIKMVI